jgi:hypothetical protein
MPTLARAKKTAKEAIDRLKPLVRRSAIAGSIRRKVSKPRDIDIIVVPKSDEAWEKIAKTINRQNPLQGGEKALTGKFRGIPIQIWRATSQGWGAALMWATGPRDYDIAYRRKAKRVGLLLNRYGLWDRDTNEFVAGKTEREIYAILRPEGGYVKPEERGRPKKQKRRKKRAAGLGMKPRSARPTENYWAVRFRDPRDFDIEEYATIHEGSYTRHGRLDWRSHLIRAYLPGAMITMMKTTAGNWWIQRILVPEEYTRDEALERAEALQFEIEDR